MDIEFFDNDASIEEMKINKNIIKHINNGLYRIIILWEVNKEPIYGYGIMKKIDLFFENQIEQGIINKSSPSKIYPILQKMEEMGLIHGYWDENNNKKVKFYEITPKGINVFNHIKFNWHEIGSNPIWKEFIHGMILNSFNEENLEDGNEVKK